ncbi:restriction endonuclease subunit S [Psychrobacter sp. PAMC 21119]|uniref:restriction endonuclease subunit S n=1 Tax=Psychrobacter sp. PAMC 21119 TaxID=1112209 RepID=UPI000288379E|nr:restriction endonuclease subunit S [Psychrobacter sp. PAMC 21119]
MGFDWTDYTLSELVEISSSKRIKRAEYIDKGIPFFRSKEIIERSKGNNISTEIFISNERFKEIKARHGAPNKGDILLTSVGTLGVAYQVKDNEVFYFKDGNLTWFRHFKDMLNQNYLYWWLTSPLTQQKLYEVSIGSTQRALTISALQKLKINLPDLSVQREIVNHLEKIHNKIQLNNQINQTLEAMAQAIFKSWFVDFDLVRAKREILNSGGSIDDAERAAMCVISSKTDEQLDEMVKSEFAELQQTANLFPSKLVDSELGEIPEGWEVSVLSEMINITGGGTPKRSEEGYWGGDIPWFSIKDIPKESDIFVTNTEECITELGLKKSSTKLLEKGTTIITARGTVGKLALTSRKMCINQSCYGITGKEVGKFYNYYNLKLATDTLKKNVHGAVFDTITTKTFDSYKTVNPDKDISSKFEIQVEPLMQKIESNLIKNQTLAELRDTLLPKLLLGELDVSEFLEENE